MENEELQEPVKAVGEKNSGRKRNRWYNLSAYFLLPIVLSQGRKYKGLVDSYLYCVNDKYTDGGDVTYLYGEFTGIDYSLTTNKRYVDHFKSKTGNHICVFDITDFKDDVELFVQGKYSKFSQRLKDILCRSESPKEGEMFSNVYKILYRTQDKRERLELLIGQKLGLEAELCSSPDIEEEIKYE